ncbi:serine/threonine-protein kinase [Acidisoma sp. C75]
MATDTAPRAEPGEALAARILALLGGTAEAGATAGAGAIDPAQAARLAGAVSILLERREMPLPLALDLLRALAPRLPGLPVGPYLREAALPARLSPRFILTEALGAGGRGAVFKALDLVRLEAGAPAAVAIKLGDAGTEQTVRRLFAEWRQAQALAHPAILAIHDVAREGRHVFAVMDYVPGASLKALIAQRATEDRRLSTGIIEQIGEALAFVHAQHRIHGDVKPANVLVAEDGRAKLIDLSAVAVLPHLFEGRWMPGSEEEPIEVTPRYASPERLAGQGADPTDDIFSFAVMICEMLGRYPFAGVEAAGAAPQEPQLPDGLSRAARRALHKALSPWRRERWQEMDAFLRALRLPL